jgi:hypothetical protein
MTVTTTPGKTRTPGKTWIFGNPQYTYRGDEETRDDLLDAVRYGDDVYEPDAYVPVPARVGAPWLARTVLALQPHVVPAARRMLVLRILEVVPAMPVAALDLAATRFLLDVFTHPRHGLLGQLALANGRAWNFAAAVAARRSTPTDLTELCDLLHAQVVAAHGWAAALPEGDTRRALARRAARTAADLHRLAVAASPGDPTEFLHDAEEVAAAGRVTIRWTWMVQWLLHHLALVCLGYS